MNVLKVDHVSKYYNIGKNKFNIIRAILFNSKTDLHCITALDDISFNVNKGEAFGIIGRNGAGKSTLLQIIAGTLRPNSGEIIINGRISALLELGSGFNPDFTGIENIYLSGSILGIKKDQMDSKLNEIKMFADIGDYINEPVRTYSSGMLMRVAFSVAVAVEPDLLIIDEALSVGDILFQQKCNSRLKDLLSKGVSLLVVTHDTSFVLNICRKALWIENGKMAYLGSANECVKQYLASMASKSTNPYANLVYENRSKITKEPVANSLNILEADNLGGGAVVISKAWLLDQDDNQTNIFKIGARCNVYLLIKAKKLISNVSAGIELRDRHGQIIFVTGLRVIQKTIRQMHENEVRLVKISFDTNISTGQYTLDLGCGSGFSVENNTYHKVLAAAIIEIIANKDLDIVHGMVKLPYSIEF